MVERWRLLVLGDDRYSAVWVTDPSCDRGGGWDCRRGRGRGAERGRRGSGFGCGGTGGSHERRCDERHSESHDGGFLHHVEGTGRAAGFWDRRHSCKASDPLRRPGGRDLPLRGSKKSRSRGQMPSINYPRTRSVRVKRGGGGIRTLGSLRFAGFQDQYIRPLCHPSSTRLRRAQPTVGTSESETLETPGKGLPPRPSAEGTDADYRLPRTRGVRVNRGGGGI